MQAICAGCNGQFEPKRKEQRYCSYACSNTQNARKREQDKLNAGRHVSVWSCGGGVDSTAIAVLIVTGKLPKPDLAVMVDCGWERPSTMGYVRTVLQPRLNDVGISLQIVRSADWKADTSLFDRSGRCVIPAYRALGNGEVQKLGTRCGPWKRPVLKRWLRSKGVSKATNWVGMAADEARRAKPARERWIIHRYPLIEFGMTRADCVFAIGAAGWPRPIRTSCIMCPQRSLYEWRMMRGKWPAEFARACEIDEQLRSQDARLFIHPACLPLCSAVGKSVSPPGAG